MKYIITSIVCLAVGIGVGLYFGYTRPSLMTHREMSKQYQQFVEETKRHDEEATAIALRAIYILDRGEVENAKHFLVEKVGSYYRLYRFQGGDTNMIANIEKAAAKYPVIAAEISK